MSLPWLFHKQKLDLTISMGSWKEFVKALTRDVVVMCGFFVQDLQETSQWCWCRRGGLAKSLVSSHVLHSSEVREKSTNLSTVISGPASAKESSSPAAGGPHLLHV